MQQAFEFIQLFSKIEPKKVGKLVLHACRENT
jgi:hypothetical protein